MRSVYSEEMDLIWECYERIILDVGFKGMMLNSEKVLINAFTLNYKDLFYKVIENNKFKSREEISYSVLKLRRLMALWYKNNVWDIEGGVSYKVKDRFKQFPLFKSQSPLISPLNKTIDKLRAKCLHKYIEDYNKMCKTDSYKSNSKVKHISNLRDLRNVLVSYEKIDEASANEIIKLYGSVVAKKEVNDFSNDTLILGF